MSIRWNMQRFPRNFIRTGIDCKVLKEQKEFDFDVGEVMHLYLPYGIRP